MASKARNAAARATSSGRPKRLIGLVSRIWALVGSTASAGSCRCADAFEGVTRDAANEWLLRYPGDAAVMPYIGRSGWNNLTTGGGIPDDEILEAVDASYAMVVGKLPKKDRPA